MGKPRYSVNVFPEPRIPPRTRRLGLTEIALVIAPLRVQITQVELFLVSRAHFSRRLISPLPLLLVSIGPLTRICKILPRGLLLDPKTAIFNVGSFILLTAKTVQGAAFAGSVRNSYKYFIANRRSSLETFRSYRSNRKVSEGPVG